MSVRRCCWARSPNASRFAAAACWSAVNSVAGERGRAANYVYGSAKAGLTAFLSGLRNRLAASGVPQDRRAGPAGATDRGPRRGGRRAGRRVAPGPRRRVRPPHLAAGHGTRLRHPGAPLQADARVMRARRDCRWRSYPPGLGHGFRQGCRRDRTTARRAGRDEPPCAGGFVEVGAWRYAFGSRCRVKPEMSSRGRRFRCPGGAGEGRRAPAAHRRTSAGTSRQATRQLPTRVGFDAHPAPMMAPPRRGPANIHEKVTVWSRTIHVWRTEWMVKWSPLRCRGWRTSPLREGYP